MTLVRFSQAKALEASHELEAEALYRSIIEEKVTDSADENIQREKEAAVVALIELLGRRNRSDELAELARWLRPYFDAVSRAKTAKIVRILIETLGRCTGSSEVLMTLCHDVVQWCREEKRTFLRQRVETRLVALYLERKQYPEALALISSLLQEVRRMDDRSLLLEVQLLETRLHHALRNIPKARAALTAARATANAIYVPPALQGEIDMLAGIIYAEERDYKTAFSYFYEAFEVFASVEDSRALASLKYLLLCKVMTQQTAEIAALLQGRLALRYQGREVDAMRELAAACEKRSVHELERVLREHQPFLADDPIIRSHLDELYHKLLERNILRILEPYRRIDLARLAAVLDLPVSQIEAKCSQLILDGKLDGIIDQGTGCLIVHDTHVANELYIDANQVIKNLDEAVSNLFLKAARLR
jgi:26S proteasome regulatory subunit N6